MIRPARSLWKLFPAAAAVLLAAGVLAGCALTGRTVEQAKTITPATPAGFKQDADETGPLEKTDALLQFVKKKGFKNAYSWSFTKSDEWGDTTASVKAVAMVTENEMTIKQKDVEKALDELTNVSVAGTPVESSKFTPDLGAASSAGVTMTAREGEQAMTIVFWIGMKNNVSIMIQAATVGDAGSTAKAIEPAVEKMARAMIKKAS